LDIEVLCSNQLLFYFRAYLAFGILKICIFYRTKMTPALSRRHFLNQCNEAGTDFALIFCKKFDF